MTPRPDPEPRLDLLESCWTFKSPNSKRVISCGIYRTDTGLETRAGYSPEAAAKIDFAAGTIAGTTQGKDEKPAESQSA